MDEAALAALFAELAAFNARCAANPREAANFAAQLRRTPRAEKECWLFNSALNNNATLVRLLLADGLSPNTTDPERWDNSVLHFAAQGGSINVVRLLLEAGAEASSLDNLGNTPLQAAVAYGKLTCARELIPHTDLLHFNASGNNVLHKSIIVNQPEIFKLLLPHFADNVDVRTIKQRPPGDPDAPFNYTPLMMACQGGHHAMVKAFLAVGASRTAHDSNSFSCLHFAAQHGHLACVTLLIGRPENQKMSAAEINARANKGQTTLHRRTITGTAMPRSSLPAQILLLQCLWGSQRWI